MVKLPSHAISRKGWAPPLLSSITATTNIALIRAIDCNNSVGAHQPVIRTTTSPHTHTKRTRPRPTTAPPQAHSRSKRSHAVVRKSSRTKQSMNSVKTKDKVIDEQRSNARVPCGSSHPLNKGCRKELENYITFFKGCCRGCCQLRRV